MTMHEAASIPTRQSLLERLRDWDHQEDWRQFFDTYWRLIHATACKAGLTDAEAQEVVQEVMIAAAKKLPEFRYEPGRDSLKGWLLAVTRWKVADEFRKRRRPGGAAEPERPASPSGDATDRTATIARIPAVPGDGLEVAWEGEWRDNLLRAALDRVKQRVNPAQYEMYHLRVIEGHSSRATAQALGVSVAQVYLAKLRVGRLLRAEVKRLEAAELIRPSSGGKQG